MKVTAIVLMLLATLVTISVATAQASDNVILYFFWGQGCPHCAAEKPFLEKMEQKYPQLEVKEFETWYNRENAELFQKFVSVHSVPPPYGVPTTFVGNDYVVGYNSDTTTGKQIENLVKNCIQYGCQDAGEGIISTPTHVTPAPLTPTIVLTPIQTAATSTQMPVQTTATAPTPPTPGFEILYGIIGLSLIAYLLNGKKRR